MCNVVVLYEWNLISLSEGRMQIEYVWEKSAEENITLKREEVIEMEKIAYDELCIFQMVLLG
jgi:hypothetical protein